MSLLRIGCVVAFALTVRAELPLARLHSIFPPGAQQGTSVELTVEGADLDDATGVYFSTAEITSERNPTNAAGVFTVSVSSNVPPGLYEARVVGRFGISNPRYFSVGDRAELSAKGENLSPDKAMAVPIESTVNAFATAAAAQYYKFEAKADERLVIICEAEPFDSRMTPALVLSDWSGQELKRERRDGRLEITPALNAPYLLKVHDLQFRGGKQLPYRLTLTTRTNLDSPPRLARLPLREERGLPKIAEQESKSAGAQKVSPPCEVQGRFFPENDVDRFEFEAKKGEIFWVEVLSDKLGERTAPFALVERVARSENGEESTSDIQELNGSDNNLGGQFFNTATRDPSGRVEIKEDGTYRIQVRDLFNMRADPTRSYRLLIRRETPDFDLVGLVLPPPSFDKDNREARTWSSFLRGNDSLLIKVLALRRDNFSGEIGLHVDGLPPGVQASDSVIPEGQNAGWLSLSSNSKVSDWHGAIRITGQGKAGATEIKRVAAGASVIWDVPDYNNESVRSRLMRELVLATATDNSPFTIEPKQIAWQVPQSTVLSIPLHLARSAEFKQPVKLRAYVDTQNEPLKEWHVEGAAVDTNFELDLKQSKLAAGAHQLFFLAQTSGKIRRVRADEAAALESAAAKENEAERKRIQERIQWRDASGIFNSPIVKVFVNPAATASK